MSASHDNPQEPSERWDASRAIELELEARDQERIAITKLVEQAHRLIQEAISDTPSHDVLVEASSQLDKAIQLLKWPLPHAPS
ncbi:hypothetical protein D3C78_1558580 [compost metagenome]